MKKIAIIGAGISGLSIAQLLHKKHKVTVYESDSRPGGLIKCDCIQGNLFHRTGGHVFNTKRQDVFNWFWTFFNQEQEFVKADRNSIISMPDKKLIPYPIENHAYLFDEKTMKAFIEDLINMAKAGKKESKNFEDFLRNQFGETLYKLYFQPYNEKIWRKDLKHVPLSWLEGKLPMPTLNEIIFNNFIHLKEKSFVHSSFYYPIKGGSQFIADRFAQELNIVYNTPIHQIAYTNNGWFVMNEYYDNVIFCGNVKELPKLMTGIDISGFYNELSNLEAHGTTTVLCEIAPNPYSWIYLPSREYMAHRIICTGNFSPSNNAAGKMTATIEFTDSISHDEILKNLSLMPFTPHYLAHNFAPYTYPIQHTATREIIKSLKAVLAPKGMFLLGRFAEWEYYNMDVAMGAAIDLNKSIYFNVLI
ncbi:NAD(P)-binding protein [Bacteroides gallinaceum]|uniref:NAD(P)-binding protein n=1 Tax=Bacteroides gallinaceum TaxID=1462571 RepID=A0ABT7X4J2_9BACE|nr:NAD(P)-binding protein [Bacteroides gallinaceum]MDN0048994.1 NAD(P)-binding protein [Bacteroides gallinaceum]